MEGFGASTTRPLRPKFVPFAVAVAVIVIPQYFLLVADWGPYRPGMLRYLIFAESWFPSWLDADSQVTLAVIAIALRWEKDTWSSIGISRPSLSDAFLGLVAFLVYMDYSYTENSTLRDLIATSFSSFHFPNLTFPRAVPLLAIVAFGVLFEELATRAYIIERVFNFTDNPWLAGFGSVVVSLAIHVPGRTLEEMLRITPMTVLFTTLYVWRRNIVPAFIAHFAGNAVTTLTAYPMRQWLLWLVIPSRNWIIVPPVAALYFALRYLFERPSRLRTD